MADEESPKDQFLSDLENLKERNAFLESQSEAVIDGILVIDPEGHVISSNEHMREMWEIPKKIWNSRDDDALLQSVISKLADPDEFLNKVNYLYEKPRESSSDEINLLDGKCFERHTMPLGDSAGNTHGRIWLFRDITERKKLQLELEEAQANLEDRVELRTRELTEVNDRLSAIAANLPGIVFQDILKPDGSHYFTYVSPSVEKILGLKVDDMLHDPDLWLKNIVPEDFEALRESVIAARDSMGPWQWEGRMLLRNGEPGWFEGLAQARRLADGNSRWDGLFLDISERKRAEVALQKSEQQFRMVWEFIPIGLRLTDGDGKIINVNNSYCHMVGMPREELIGKPLSVIYEPERHDEIIAKHRVAFNEGTAREQKEVQVTLKGAKKLWLNVGNSFFTPPGAEKLLLGIFTDISRRKRDESDLVESDERFRKLSEAAFEGMVTAIDGNIINANEQFASMFGYTQDEIVGLTAMQLAHPDSQEVVMDYIRRNDESPYEAVGLRKDGTTFPFEAHGTSIPYRGEVARVTALRDITKRKEAEQNLRLSVQKTALHMEQSPLAFIEWNKNFEVAAWNKAAEKIFGFTKEEAMGRHAADLLIPEDTLHRVDEIWQSLQTESRLDRIQNTNLTKDGRIIICDWFNTRLTDESGEVIGVASLADDVTLRVQMEKEFLKAQKLESVGTLAGGLAHDFNNFLAMILLNVGSAKTQPELSEDTLDRLTAAEQSIMKAKAITEQLLTFTRGGEPMKAAANLQPLMKEGIEFALHGSPHTYNLNIPPDLWRVNIDSGQINQVINNLVLNASEAMQDGGLLTVAASNITVTEKVSVGTLSPGKYVQVEVNDDGTGISPEIINSIFDPYFSGHEGGSGLGLFSCYSILERHNGWITVQSVLGEGSTITFYLPTTDEAPGIQMNIASGAGGGRILVLDDEEAILRSLNHSLNALGYQVDLTRDGEESIAAYLQAMESGSPYTAVIFDLTIPGGKGGAETMERLLEIDPNVSAIVSSGYSNNAVMANYREYGFKGALPKPYTLQQLNEVLYRAVVSQ